MFGHAAYSELPFGASPSFVPPASLTITGQAPAAGVSYVFSPAAEALTASGQIPYAFQAVFTMPGAGTLTLAGAAPTISIGTIAQSGVGGLVLAGQVPVAKQALLAQPVVGTLTLAGAAPTIFVGTVVQPGINTTYLNLVGYAPAVGIYSTLYAYTDQTFISTSRPVNWTSAFRGANWVASSRSTSWTQEK